MQSNLYQKTPRDLALWPVVVKRDGLFIWGFGVAIFRPNAFHLLDRRVNSHYWL